MIGSTTISLLLDEIDEATKCELKRMIVRLNLFQEELKSADVEDSSS